MRFVAGLVFSIIFVGIVLAQSPDKTGAPTQVAPPLGDLDNHPLAGSPFEYFRHLIEMSPGDRKLALAQKPENKRKSLEEKIVEYSAMTTEEREARLRLTEVWYFLQPLLGLAPSQRAARLATVPDADRPLIEDRLKTWDLVPSERRKQFLENELSIQFFLRLDPSTPAQREHLQGKSPDEWKNLEEKLKLWRARPEEERQRMYEQFQEFFGLSPNEKEKTLHVLSETERQKLEKSLRAFEQLPQHQRAMCIESFRKFENMSKEERDEFLKNVSRWQVMSPRDRQTWINLINLLPAQSGPPVPGGIPTRPPPGISTNPVSSVGSKTPPKLPGQK